LRKNSTTSSKLVQHKRNRKIQSITGTVACSQSHVQVEATGSIRNRINALFDNPQRRALALVLVEHSALTWKVADDKLTLEQAYELLDHGIGAKAPDDCHSWEVFHKKYNDRSWDLWATVKKRLRESGLL